jgi:hypothetical protein
MASALPHTINLKGRPQRREALAGGAIIPGHLLVYNTSAQFVVATPALLGHPRIFAAENELLGQDVNIAYASGDRVVAWHCGPGDEVWALLAAAATAVVIGSHLEAAADGTIRLRTTGVTIGIALQAVDNSAGGQVARVKMLIA